jgi:hypothetical protein
MEKTKIGSIQNEDHDGYLEANTTYLITAPEATIDQIGPKEFQPKETYNTLDDILDEGDGIFTDCFRWQQKTETEEATTTTSPKSRRAREATKLEIIDKAGITRTTSIFDTTRPGPNLADRKHAIGSKAFAIEAMDGITTQKARPIRNHELLTALGYADTEVATLTDPNEIKWTEVFDRLSNTAPRHTFDPLIPALYAAETTNAEKQIETQWQENYGKENTDTTRATYGDPERGICLLNRVIDRWTTLPVPTKEMWQAATTADQDLSLVLTSLQNETALQRAPLTKKKYHDEWKDGKLEHKNGTVYQLEVPKATRIWQLRRRVVPINLRPTIMAAYHATPLAGHTGLYKTYWQIAARFWWPGIYTKIRKAVLHCAHCRVANSTSHQAQQILGALSTNEPFDIICVDVWHPGKTHQKTDTFQRAVLTCLCNLTGFVSLAFLTRIDSELVTRIAFSHFFCPNGLPKMVILDGGSKFKGMLVEVCEALGVQYHVVTPENPNAILCKRFHRYMNKVQRLGAADM